MLVKLLYCALKAKKGMPKEDLGKRCRSWNFTWLQVLSCLCQGKGVDSSLRERLMIPWESQKSCVCRDTLHGNPAVEGGLDRL